MADCCQLVGNLDLGINNGCIISVSSSSTTEVIMACGDEPLEGATTGTISLSAYASTDLWVGCACRAGVSIPFIRKYDCIEDKVYFIFSGQGQSFYTGDKPASISLVGVLNSTTDSISASSSSGPASIYSNSKQYNGFGMRYTGEPISFTTTPKGTEIDIGGVFGNGPFYLQNFSFEAQPGQLPVVTYSLVYSIGGN